MPFLQNRLNCTENSAFAADSVSVAEKQTSNQEAEPVKYFWIRAPKAMVYNQNFSDGAKLLYLILLDYQGRNSYAFPSLETLANDTGKSVRRVQQLLKELEAGEVIEIVAQPGWVNLYRVGLPPAVVATDTTNVSKADVTNDSATADKNDATNDHVTERLNISQLSVKPSVTKATEECLQELQDSTPAQKVAELPMKNIAAELDSAKLKNMCEKSRVMPSVVFSSDQTNDRYQREKPALSFVQTEHLSQASQNRIKTVPKASLSNEQQKTAEILKAVGVASVVAEQIALTNPKYTDVQQWIELAKHKTNPGGYLAVVLGKAAPPPVIATPAPTTPTQQNKQWCGRQRNQSASSGAVAYMQRHQTELEKWQNVQTLQGDELTKSLAVLANDDQPLTQVEPIADNANELDQQIRGIVRQLDRTACQYIKQAVIEGDKLIISFVGNYQPSQNIADWLSLIKTRFADVCEILLK